ncbi:MAG: tetratricopeptide repeat protein [Anaerolineaceae bacterium]|nr:tetratricopeptide repeat protein [Anaerolineaceae bacterium]
MKSGSASANSSQALLSILPVLLLPLGLVLLAVIITYFRRRQQSKANPQIRFDKPLWRASFDTFGAVVLIWAILYFLFPIQDNQIRFSPQLSGLFSNPIIAIGTIIFIPLAISGIFLWYLINGVKPLVYRGDYDRALKFVLRWKWLPVMQNILINLEGSILHLAGRYTEAEACFSKVEVASRNPKKNQRQARGSNLGSLGWALMRQQRYAEALKVFEESIELYPEGSDNFSGLGETLLWMGNASQEALKYLDRGIENKRYRMNTDRFVWGELLANRAWALAQSGDCDQALKTYQQALTETEQECLPALAGLHVRGAYILRLCGDDAKATSELNAALKIDPSGGYGQLAKAALDVPQEKIGLSQLSIPADGVTVVNAIRRSTPPQRTIKTVRENLMLVAQGSSYSYVYLLRPQTDGSTVLQVVVDQAASVENAINNTDLKAGLTSLMANVKRTTTDSGYAAEHLKSIANAVSQPAPAAEAAEAVPPTATSTGGYDTAAVFARKSLPSVTAKDRPAGSLNPSWYAGMSFVMTPFISSLVLSYFWRRLGKTSWMWISMAFAILLPLVGLGGAFILARNAPPNLQFSLILGGAGIWYGYAFALASVLEGPYQKWHQGGKEALVNYPYKWGRAALVGMGTVAAAVILGTVLTITQPGPQKFDHELMSLTYPPNWTVGDTNKLQSCATDSECFAWLYEKRYGYSNILFGRFHLTSTNTAASVERFTWNNLSRQNEGMTLELRDTVQISGMEAARRFYFYPSNDPAYTEKVYGMQIYLVRGEYAYFISEWSANKGIFNENKTAIDQILSSYVLKAGLDGFASKPVRWSYPIGNPLVNWG